ncbi:MAG: radical SAM protein [Methanospirillum sp.]|nr:radical SAM protein [Methanospirillum sp.]
MMWTGLKARLLAIGGISLTGLPADEYIARSRAGPGAGGSGSVFFSMDGHRVRLGISEGSPARLHHSGLGKVLLSIDGEEYSGVLEKPGFHCPRQAYITITSSCIFDCRYCNVPRLPGYRKDIDEIERMVASVLPDIDAISLTSGILTDAGEEEQYTLEVVKRLGSFNLPIGVSIYPVPGTPERLHGAGVAEVKFNLETATPALFEEMCPGLSRTGIIDALSASVPLFGRDHVYSNIILGLGETDGEMLECIEELCIRGIIPVIRPLTPGGTLTGFQRPDAGRLLPIHAGLMDALERNGLNMANALTMCPACTGCDLIPGRD